MGAAAQVADVAPGDRALNFLTAGGDIVINGDPSIQQEMTDAVLARAEQDPEFAAEIAEKVSRISSLYEATCN